MALAVDQLAEVLGRDATADDVEPTTWARAHGHARRPRPITP